MKIRRKSCHNITEDSVETYGSPDSYAPRWTKKFPGEKRCYYADMWELVPEEKWVDVTGQITSLMVFELNGRSVSCADEFHECKVEAYVIPDDWRKHSEGVKRLDEFLGDCKTTVLQIWKKEG